MQEHLEVAEEFLALFYQNVRNIYVWLFCENVLFLALTVFTFILWIVLADISVRSKSMHVYNGAGVMLVSLFFGLTACGVLPKTATQIVLPFLGVHGGACYLLAYVIVEAKQRRALKKRQEQERLHAVQFTLPDRDNAFVRGRLQTALNGGSAQVQSALEGEKPLAEHFSHAQKLLEKLKGEQLDFGDRRQAEDMQKMLDGYMQKESWTSEDVRAVNEAFNALLKLSAKYAL